MDRIDGILGDRLLAATGSWERLSALIHLARRGHRPARVSLEEIAGARLHGILMRGDVPTDFVRDHVDFAIGDPGDDDITIGADLEIAPGIGWNGIHLLTRPGTFPDTLRLALPGRLASELIEHPIFPANTTMREVSEIGPEGAFIRIDGVPRPVVPEARRLDILRAWMSSTLPAWREGFKSAKRPKPTTMPKKAAVLALMAINLRLFFPATWPSWKPAVFVNVFSLAMCIIVCLMNADRRLRYPIMGFRNHVFTACLARSKAIEDAIGDRGF